MDMTDYITNLAWWWCGGVVVVKVMSMIKKQSCHRCASDAPQHQVGKKLVVVTVSLLTQFSKASARHRLWNMYKLVGHEISNRYFSQLSRGVVRHHCSASVGRSVSTCVVSSGKYSLTQGGHFYTDAVNLQRNKTGVNFKVELRFFNI